MSQMLNQLAYYNALDLIGGHENCQSYEVIENFMCTADKMISAKSKPFKQGKNCLEATVDYHNFFGSINCFTNHRNNFLWLTNLNEHCFIPAHITTLVSSIQEILNSNRQVPPDRLRTFEPSSCKDIDFYYTGIWNSIRGQSVSNAFKLIEKRRKALISKQCQENTRIVGRLLRLHDSLQVFRFTFNIYHQANTNIDDIKVLDESAARVYRKIATYFHQLAGTQILCIQSRIQRTLTGQYYVNIFIYTKPDTQFNDSVDLSEFRYSHENGPIQLQTFASDAFYTHNTLYATHNFAFNFEQWKVFFKCALYPLNYYYYESKHIKPYFTSILF